MKLNLLIKKNARFLPSIFLLIILITLIYQLIISDITNIKKFKIDNNNFYQINNNNLILQNQELKQQLSKLKNNNEVVESIARYEFGFIKQGEKYYTYPKVDTNE